MRSVLASIAACCGVTPQAQNIGTTGLHTDDEYYNQACHAKKGDFEFFAEIDVLCALSTCPGGTCRFHSTDPTPAISSRCADRWAWRCSRRIPLRSTAGLHQNLLPTRGFHGLRIPQWGED
jgi:hypothetical protein